MFESTWKHSNMERYDAEGAMGFRIGCRLFQSIFVCHMQVKLTHV